MKGDCIQTTATGGTGFPKSRFRFCYKCFSYVFLYILFKLFINNYLTDFNIILSIT